MKRIGIIGSAGTGKSGLGSELANRLNIPFLPAKDITRGILNNLGYDWSSGIYVEKFLAEEECQSEMLYLTIEREIKHEDFITDRTSVDLAAYAIAELNEKNPDLVEDFVEQCKKHTENYTHLIFCPWGITKLENNNIRTLNQWYQFEIHAIMLALLKEWNLSFLTITKIGDNRINEAYEFINSPLI